MGPGNANTMVNYSRNEADELSTVANAAFQWKRVDRPPAPLAKSAAADRSCRLVAAAQLAHRCAEFGVQPPLPPAPPQPQLPAHAGDSAHQQEQDRLDGLSQQLHEQRLVLAEAVQGQKQQLASQQQLLQDVMQGLLFVSAKTARPQAPAALPWPQPPRQGSIAGTFPGPSALGAVARLPAAAAHEHAYSGSPELHSPLHHRAVPAQNLANRLRAAAGNRQKGPTTAPLGQGGSVSSPSGVLQVPVMPLPDNSTGFAAYEASSSDAVLLAAHSSAVTAESKQQMQMLALAAYRR
ncbi:hypothetical protein D9Q98_005506 [Chlorella vulgaris]|uniref:Uncharacterized protein n=1 Tax=Chlorella vulgaris TaxID=3077 RepID=A0A9D4YW01_CHLVU|nr:hypothetical protein D9Q98_005506 [Chlorella vulgaris]